MKLIGCVMLLSIAIAGSALACDKDNAGLTVPPGFCASVFADGLGRARHLAVAPNGDVYVNTLNSGESIIALRDANGDGRADVIQRFGPVHQDASEGGGTGIAVFDEALYVEDAGRIVRYPLHAGALVPQGAPEIILSGLPTGRGNMVHSFAIAPDGSLFVNSGSLTDACRNDAPCPELELHAGIWVYDANKTGQVFSPAGRFASGTRNAAALAVQPDGFLYATPDGRDQLADAEVFARVQAVDDLGWPYCYYDADQGRYVLAPEYGGDGGSRQGECIAVKHRRVVFPPHWAPSAMTFYAGPAFPEKYRGGAFVAFHNSSLVAFVPFEEGRAAGGYDVFATGSAQHRPTGVAMGPDGAVYVSDDVKGRIWRITYEGAGK